MELIVVCVLIGLLLSFTAPTMRDAFIDDPLGWSARKMIGYITGLRGMALRTQQSMLVHISEQENRLWHRLDGEQTQEEEEEEDSKGVQLPKNIIISKVWIGGDGSAIEDDTVVWISKQGYLNHTMIQLEDGKGEKLTIEFQPFLDTVLLSDKFDIPSE